MPRIEIVSFGYLHGPAPDAHLAVDVRAHFKDPHVDPSLRQLTAHDQPVAHAVMATPGIPELVTALAATVHAYRAGPTPARLTIAVGCAGGRHRSAQIATALMHLLQGDGLDATVSHRDIDRPVVER
jgi:UPF0042 nucleotide-binding protein